MRKLPVANRLLLAFAVLAISGCPHPPASPQPDGGSTDGGGGDAGVTDGGSVDGGDTCGASWSGHTMDDAYRTDQIVLVTQGTQGGLTGEYYENRAYTCGRQGYQTFLIVYPAGLALTTPRPLWVRMHGGGVGAYDANGSYVPAALESYNDEEPLGELVAAAQEPGLMADVRADPAGFRLLVPSMCDHDVYSGIGIPDPNDPHSPDENGVTRAADGLLANEAALAFTRQRVSTTHVFLHGTSAGSIGAFSLAYELDRRGKWLSGAILDSHVADQGILDNATIGCMPYAYVPDLLLPKIGPLLTPPCTGPALFPAGRIHTPIYHLWDRGDPACCGPSPQTYTDASGATYTESGCQHEHGQFAAALTANPPGGAGVSVSVEVCVNDATTTTPGACNRHSPTRFAYDLPTPPGDQLAGGADYNARIMDWVHARLNDPVPP